MYVGSGADGLSLHLAGFANDLIRSSLDDASGSGKVCTGAHEVDIDVASCLATFIDAPEQDQQWPRYV